MARVLAFSCHPDDLELMCAGVLALLSEKGHEIHMATMCVGDLGSAEKDRIEIARIRLEECRCAAALIGAEFHCAMLKDVFLEDRNEHRAKGVAIVPLQDPRLNESLAFENL